MNNDSTSSKSFLKRLEEMHPQQLLLIFGLIGILLLFVVLLFAYTYTIIVSEVTFSNHSFPKSFIFSLIIIGLSSFILQSCFEAFRKEDLKKIYKSLSITLFLGLCFFVTQFLGWKQLWESGIFFNGKAVGSYLYLLSGLHALHLLGGMVFLLIFMFQISDKEKDEVKKLVYITNPYELFKLKMLAFYWHTMGVLWGVLFFVFLSVF
jgi:cytochrome c oxidase subunit 3